MSGVTELEPPATDLITLTRHILSQQHELGERASGDLTLLLVAIQVCPSPSRTCSSGWSAGCGPQDKGRCTVGESTMPRAILRGTCKSSDRGMSSISGAGIRAPEARQLQGNRRIQLHENQPSAILHILISQVTSKYIASNVRKARLINLVGLAGEQNVQGEDQKKLDVLSNDIMVNALRASGKCSVMVSEEVDEAIVVTGSKGT